MVVKFAILRRSALTGGLEPLRTYQCQLDRPANELRRHKKANVPLFEIARVLEALAKKYGALKPYERLAED